MATKKVLVEIEVKQSGGKIPKIGKEIDGLTSAQKKYNNALQDNIDAHSDYSKSTQKLKKESAETRRQMTLEEASAIKLTKAQEKLAFEQSDLGKQYAKTNIQSQLQRRANEELAIEQMKLADSTEHATDKMQQFKTTAGLSGAIVTEFGRTISDLPYGIRGVGNNVSQLVTLFGLFSQNVVKAGGTMKDGFKLLFSQMTGVIGIMTALQIVIAGFQSGVIQDFIARIMEGSTALIGLKKSISGVKDEFGGLTAELDVYTHILESSTRSVKEKEDAYAKIVDKFPELENSIKRVGDEFIVSAEAVDKMKESLEELAISSAAMERLKKIQSERLAVDVEQRIETDSLNRSLDETIDTLKEQNLLYDYAYDELKGYRDIVQDVNSSEEERIVAMTKSTDLIDRSLRRQTTQTDLLDGYDETLNKLRISTEDYSEATKKSNEESEKEIAILKDYIKVSGKDDDRTPRGGKSVSIFKANLLNLAKLEEKFRQESKKSEIKTEEELIKEKTQFAKDDLDITINSFIEKEKLRLKEFIDKQELKKKEKNADVNLINQSIANAKIKTSQSIKLAKQEADGVIEQINNVEKSELRLAERRSTERLRGEQEKKEVTDREIAQLERQIERANELVEKDESGKITGTTPASKLSNKLEEDALFIQSEIDRESALLDNEALSDLQRAEIQKRRTEREKDLAENRVLYAQAEQNAKEQMLTQTAGLLSASAALAEKDSATQKALAITSTIVSTYSAAQKAYESQFSPVPTASSPVRASIAAATAVAKGLANVKAITSGGKSSPSQGGGATTVKPPDFNIIGSSGVNQLAEAIGSTDDRPIKAYVVSSEVTTQQALDRNTRDSATL